MQMSGVKCGAQATAAASEARTRRWPTLLDFYQPCLNVTIITSRDYILPCYDPIVIQAMATQVPGTQDEFMQDAPGNGNADGQDDDAIVAGEDLVVRVVGVLWSLLLKYG